MSIRVNYKGPEIHTRELSQADFEAVDVEFGGYELKTMVWLPGEARKSVKLDDDMPADVRDSILEVIGRDALFEIKDGNTVVKEADPNASMVRADGSDVSGAGGSEVLASTIDPDETGAAVAGSTSGGTAAPSTATSSSRRTSTTGGSTSGS